jgi:D-lactate dehydrogenase (cytochrome)
MLHQRTDDDTLNAFASDESNLYAARDLQAVCYPETAEDVAELLTRCQRDETLVTVSGAGTGITGGRVALYGGIVLATETLCQAPAGAGQRLDYEHYGRGYTAWLEEARGEVTVPAGLSLEVLDRMLPAHWLFPPDPTERTALVGGVLATNASGARSFHYGATRAWVAGLTVVLPQGETLTVRRGEVQASEGRLRFTASGVEYDVPLPGYCTPPLKCASGLATAPDLDLVDLFIGSEGTLGVITSATLKLAPRPPQMVGEIAFFNSEAEALDLVAALRQAAAEGTLPVLSLEFFDERSLRFMSHEMLAGKQFAAAVFTELAGDLEALDPLLEALEACGSQEDWFAETPEDLHEQKAFRHSLPEGVNSDLRRHGSQKLGTDFVVPPECFPEVLAAYHRAGQSLQQRFPREGEHYLMFGHIGDQHLHVNFLTRTEAERAAARELYVELAQEVVSRGGVLSGEHGIGKKSFTLEGRSVPYLELMLGRESLLEIARTKLALDPQGLLNRGNLVPPEYLNKARESAQ